MADYGDRWLSAVADALEVGLQNLCGFLDLSEKEEKRFMKLIAKEELMELTILDMMRNEVGMLGLELSIRACRADQIAKRFDVINRVPRFEGGKLQKVRNWILRYDREEEGKLPLLFTTDSLYINLYQREDRLQTKQVLDKIYHHFKRGLYEVHEFIGHLILEIGSEHVLKFIEQSEEQYSRQRSLANEQPSDLDFENPLPAYNSVIKETDRVIEAALDVGVRNLSPFFKGSKEQKDHLASLISRNDIPEMVIFGKMLESMDIKELEAAIGEYKKVSERFDGGTEKFINLDQLQLVQEFGRNVVVNWRMSSGAGPSAAPNEELIEKASQDCAGAADELTDELILNELIEDGMPDEKALTDELSPNDKLIEHELPIGGKKASDELSPDDEHELDEKTLKELYRFMEKELEDEVIMNELIEDGMPDEKKALSPNDKLIEHKLPIGNKKASDELSPNDEMNEHELDEQTMEEFYRFLEEED